MTASSFRFCMSVLVLIAGPVLFGPVASAQQHGQGRHHGSGGAMSSSSPVLQAPGQSVFGTVQEAIRRLEADSTTDWSRVDMAALRQHLLDMERVAMDVAVEAQTPIDGGVRLRVRPTQEAARASLDRVLDAHPHMLRQETGWMMTVTEDGDAYVLRVTTRNPREVDKIRGLGYIGLLAYGQHHQRHHWHLVRGAHPHE
ncbi:hypothetical protein GGP72_000292 [Salinibacter ruber]|uniref:Uncharacterized protein n=1 Tax=Salinibacter ruber TaxID=146919 RepID=A0A9X2TFD7_9BACT|nr:hypothetical protein [Salinibacter ruber]MCS3676396.1 hypothetical protein [Salinibacter ruber]MCS3679683.1 hypothetical protein [Salinibacter ruber]